MNGAARIKQHKHEVRDEARKAEVIANAVCVAKQVGVPPDLASQIYEFWDQSTFRIPNSVDA